MSDSSSVSEEEIFELMNNWDEEEGFTLSPRRIFSRTNYMMELSEYDFMYRFRLNKTAVSDLLLQIQPHLSVNSSRNFGVSPLLQLLLALRFYALGTMLVSVADYIGVSIATASRIIASMSQSIAKLYPDYVKLEGNTQTEFYSIARFPRVHGAIDGTHVLIQSPCSTIGEEFRNRKGFFSLNVQVTCNAALIFLDVVARWPGSTHDTTIFNNSNLKAQCENGKLQGRWLLGDSAYPCTPYLLTPLLHPTSRAEQLYNEAHIKTRNTIERCIGVWKRRFPVLALKMRLKLVNIQAVIIATAVLHNVARKLSLQEMAPEVDIDLELGRSNDQDYHNEVPQMQQECSSRQDVINLFENSFNSILCI